MSDTYDEYLKSLDALQDSTADIIDPFARYEIKQDRVRPVSEEEDEEEKEEDELLSDYLDTPNVRVSDRIIVGRPKSGTPMSNLGTEAASSFLEDSTPAELPERLETASRAVNPDIATIPADKAKKALEPEGLEHLGALDPLDFLRRYGWQAVAFAGSALPDTDRDDALGQASRFAQELVGIYGGGIPDASDARNFQTDSDLIHYVLNPLITSDVEGLMTATGKSLVDSASAVYESWQDGTISDGDAYRKMAEIMESASSPTAVLRRPGEGFEKSPRRQMRENLYAAVADGDLQEAGIRNIPRNYYDFARGEADTLKEKPLEFIFTVGGLAPGVPYLTGRDVVDAMLTKEEAERYAEDATNDLDRLYFESLTSDIGREIVGMGYEILYDPLWLAGPAKGVQVIHKGGQALALSADGVRAARVLNELKAVGDSRNLDDYMRLVAGVVSDNVNEAEQSRKVLQETADNLRRLQEESLLAASEKGRLVGNANLESLTSRVSARLRGRADVGLSGVSGRRVSDYRQKLEASVTEAQNAVREAIDRFGNVDAPGVKTAKARQARAEAKLAQEGTASGLVASGRVDLLRYKKARQQADQIDTVLNQLSSNRLAKEDLVKEAGRFAYVNPITGRTEFLSQLPIVQPIVRKMGASTSAKIKPYRLEELQKQINSLAEKNAVSTQQAIDLLDGPKKLAYMAHQAGSTINDFRGATWSLLRQTLGTRHIQPAFSRVRDAADAARLIQLGRLPGRLAGDFLGQLFDSRGMRMVKLREVNPEIWNRYDRAVTSYFKTMEARKASLLKAQRRYMAVAENILADRKQRASRNEPGYEKYATAEYTLQSVVDEALDLIETGAGTLRSRPELIPLVESMDKLVLDFAARPDVTASVDEVRQALISIVRFAKGNPEMIRMHQQELDLLENLASEAAAIERVTEAIEKAKLSVLKDEVALKKDAALNNLNDWKKSVDDLIASVSRGVVDPDLLQKISDDGYKDLSRAINAIYDAAKVQIDEPAVKVARATRSALRKQFNDEMSTLEKQMSEAEKQMNAALNDRVQVAQDNLDKVKTSGNKESIAAARDALKAQKESRKLNKADFKEALEEARKKVDDYKKKHLEAYDSTTKEMLNDLASLRKSAQSSQTKSKRDAVSLRKDIRSQSDRDIRAEAAGAVVAATAASEKAIRAARTAKTLSPDDAKTARQIRRSIVDARPRLEPPPKVDGIDAMGQRQGKLLTERRSALEERMGTERAAGNAALADQLEARINRIDELILSNKRTEDLKTAIQGDIQQIRGELTQKRAELRDLSQDTKANKAEINRVENEIEKTLFELERTQLSLRDLSGQKFLLEEWENKLWSQWRALTGKQRVKVSRISDKDLDALATAEAAAQKAMDKFASTVTKGALRNLDAKGRRDVLQEAQRLRTDYVTKRNNRIDAQKLQSSEVEVTKQYTDKDMLLATFAVLRNVGGPDSINVARKSPLFRDMERNYPQIVTQRLGDLPDDMIPLVEELSRIFKSYEELYKQHGMGFVKNPTKIMQDWGVINYVPHVSTVESTAQSVGVLARRTAGGKGVERALDTMTEAMKRRSLAGTMAEINAINNNTSTVLRLDPIAMQSRYLQANRALSADEMMKALVEGDVIKVITPDYANGKTISRIAQEQDMVPLFEVAGSKQQEMMDIIDQVLTDPKMLQLSLRSDPQQLKKLQQLADALANAGISERTPLAVAALESKKYARAAVIEHMYAFLRAKEMSSPATAAQQTAARLKTELDDLTRLSQMQSISSRVEPTDLKKLYEMFSDPNRGGLPPDEAWDRVAELFNAEVSELGLKSMSTNGAFLKEYFEGTNTLTRMYVPRAVRQSLDEIFDSRMTEGLKAWFDEGPIATRIAQVWRGVNNFWKSRTTVMAVAFHTVNAMGNKISEMMDIGVGGALSPRTNAMSAAIAGLAPYIDRYGSLKAAQEALTKETLPTEKDVVNRLLATSTRRRELGDRYFRSHIALLRAMAGNIDSLGKRSLYRPADPTELFDIGDGVPRTIDELFQVMYKGDVIAEDYQQVIDLDRFADDMAELMDKSNYTSSGFDALRSKWRAVKKTASFAEDVILGVLPNVISGGIPVAIPKRFGAAVGRRVENVSRINNFIAGLRQGRTVDEAAQSVQKFLFDYSDLTEVQRTILRNVMPFFTWTHKNLLLQIDQAYTHPQYAAAYYKALVQGMPRIAESYAQQKEIEADNPTRFDVSMPYFNRSDYIKGIPEYARSRHVYRVGTDQFVFGLRTPQETAFENLGMLVDLAGTPISVINTLRDEDLTRIQAEMGEQDRLRLLSQSHMLIRMAVELATERSLYYGVELTEANNADTIRAVYEGLNDVSPMMAEQWRQANDLTIILEAEGDETFTLPMVSYSMNLLYGRMLNEVAASTSFQQHAVTSNTKLYDRSARADVRSPFWMAADAMTGINVKTHDPMQQRRISQHILNSALEQIYMQGGLFESYEKQYIRD